MSPKFTHLQVSAESQSEKLEHETMYCTYCGQEFSRAEHLERHILTHTNVKPYKCKTCHISFRRQDLLRRHILQIHEEADDSTKSEVAPFQRPIACSSCAKAKIKCDKQVPACGRCVSKGLQCQLRTSQHSSEAVLQAKQQFEAYTKSSHGTFSDSGVNSADKSRTPNGRQGEDYMAEQDHISSKPSSPQPNSRGFPTRHTARNDFFALRNDLLTHDHNFGRAEVGQDHQNETRKSLPQGMPLTQDTVTDRYQNSTSEGYNRDDHHQLVLGDDSFHVDFADMSSYMSFDPTDTNMFQSARFLADPPAPGVALIASATAIADGSLVHDQDALGVDFETWSCFRCNRSSGKRVHPKTGRMFLEGLEHTLRSHDIAQPFKSLISEAEAPLTFNNRISVEPFSSGVRDRLMVVTQSILHKARKIHGFSAREVFESHPHHTDDSNTNFEVFSILPSTDIMERLLQAYNNRFEPYYAFIPSQLFSPRAVLDSMDERCFSLLLLLMFAQGAMATPTKEARYLTSGLTEACRLSWFDLVEKDVSLSLNPTMLRSALMFMNLAAWSGNKWHMDLAAAQLDMYISMLRHSGLLTYRERDREQETNESAANWKSWKDYECGNRLVYSWVVVDQELSLFHDMPPKLSIAELDAAMPDQDMLWFSSSAEEWSRIYKLVYSSTKVSVPRNPPSLKHVFRRFMNRDPKIQALDFSPTQLRLYLHPLQAMVCHLYECLDCFADGGNDRQSQRLITQLEEVQSILKVWYTMCSRSRGKTGAFDCATCANLVIYHLISLNTMTNFREMEKFARGELPREEFQRSYWTQVRCVEEAARIWFHCGQAVRLTRMMPRDQKPPWWPAAIYRVAIIMWATGTANINRHELPPSLGRGSSDDTFLIDGLTPEHPSILRYLRYCEGTPVLSKQGGGFLSLNVPGDTLRHCVEVLSEEPATTRLAEGIIGALTSLLSRQNETK